MEECTAMRQKSAQQRETAAASINRMQKQHQEKSSELHAKIRELSNNVKEVRIGYPEP